MSNYFQINVLSGPKSILWRLMIPSTIIISILVASGIYLLTLEYNHRLTDKISIDSTIIKHVLSSETESLAESMSIALMPIANNHQVKRKIKSNNSEGLYNDWDSTFQQLQSRIGVNHFTFTDSNLNRVLRVNKPWHETSKVKSVSGLIAKNSKNISWGFEIQPELKELLLLRVVNPILDTDNKIIGLVELGIDIGKITKEINRKTGIPNILIIDKKFLEKKHYEERTKLISQRTDWDMLPSYIIANHSFKSITNDIKNEIIYLNRNIDKIYSELSISDESFLLSSIGVLDVSQKEIGRLYYFSNITKTKTFFTKAIVITSIIGSLLLFALFLYVHALFSKADKLINTRNKVLRESESKYKSLFNKIGYAVILHDTYGNFIDFNQKAIEYHGYSREELLMMKPENIIHKDFINQFYQNIPKVIAGEKMHLEVLHTKKDGSIFPVEVQPTMVAINDNPIILSVIRDLTESKKTSKKIQYQSTLFQAILNTTNDGFWIVNKKGQLIEVNDNYCQMSGYSREELLLLKVSDLESYSSRDIPVQTIKMLYEKGSAKFEAIHKRKDGSLFDVRISLSINKKQNETITFIEDISRIKDYEQKLIQSNNRFKLAEAAGDIASWEWNVKKDYVVWSENATKILGYNIDETNATNKSFFEYIHEDDRELFSNNLSESIKNKKDFRLEFRIRQKNGSVIWVLNMASIANKENDDPDIMFGVLQNIDKRKRSEMQLEKSLQEKEILLNEIHHRVKNNLQIITSLIYLQSLQVKENGIKELFSHSLNRIKSMALLHELLYQSKNFGSINIYQYIKRIVFELQEAYNSSISLKLNIDPECTIKTNNAVYYGLIVNELISNAFKHAFKDFSIGEIQVGFVSNLHNFVLWVSDNGTGINNMEEKMQSNSLGFKIVKTLTKQLNGEMNFKGDEGTTIEISFPKE